MHDRLPYAKLRLAVAIDRFLCAQTRQEKALAARWVSAWAMFYELYGGEEVRRHRQRPF